MSQIQLLTSTTSIIRTLLGTYPVKEFISVKCSDKRDAYSTLLSFHVPILMYSREVSYHDNIHVLSECKYCPKVEVKTIMVKTVLSKTS